MLQAPCQGCYSANACARKTAPLGDQSSEGRLYPDVKRISTQLRTHRGRVLIPNIYAKGDSPLFARLSSLPTAWWSRVSRSKGPTKIVWGCLPVALLFVCCIGGTAIGQSAGVIAVPPTKTPGPPTATATPRLARNTATPEAEPTAASSTPTVAAVATDAPAAAPTEPPVPQPAQGPAAPIGNDCPPGFPIKGNQGDEWIYHVPGGRSYSRTEPEQCFATEADARSAGYRAAQN